MRCIYRDNILYIVFNFFISCNILLFFCGYGNDNWCDDDVFDNDDSYNSSISPIFY